MRRMIILFLLFSAPVFGQGVLVMQTDFGEKDGAVSAMKGVAISVSRDLRIFDVTHEIPPFNIWEASYRLYQTARYWPKGTVFVSVVDPGVGSERKSIVMKSRMGQYFVTPDNGTLTLISQNDGVEEVRVIDESKNRLPGSGSSYTFHGRDVYAYTGARLAAGVIKFEDVGPLYADSLVHIPYQKPGFSRGRVNGTIEILDVQYGNVWTNIPKKMVDDLSVGPGDFIQVRILENEAVKYSGRMKVGNTFSDVDEGAPVGYFNSLMNFSLAIRMGNFSATHGISSGPGWKIELWK